MTLKDRVFEVLKAMGQTTEGWVVEESVVTDPPHPNRPYRVRVQPASASPLKSFTLSEWWESPERARVEASRKFDTRVRELVDARRAAVRDANAALASAERGLQRIGLFGKFES